MENEKKRNYKPRTEDDKKKRLERDRALREKRTKTATLDTATIAELRKLLKTAGLKVEPIDDSAASVIIKAASAQVPASEEADPPSYLERFAEEETGPLAVVLEEAVPFTEAMDTLQTQPDALVDDLRAEVSDFADEKDVTPVGVPVEVLHQVAEAEELAGRVSREIAARNGSLPKAEDVEPLHLFDNSGQAHFSGKCRVCGQAYRTAKHIKGDKVSNNGITIDRARERVAYAPAQQRSREASANWHKKYAALPDPKASSVFEHQAADAFVINFRVLSGEGPTVPLSLHQIGIINRDSGAVLKKFAKS